MKKKLIFILLMIMVSLIITGCEEKAETKTMDAITSVYPVEYITNNLYGESIDVESIYPPGTYYTDYNLTNEQLKKYAIEKDLFIYNGNIEKEKEYAVKLINLNKKIKVIDATQGMNYENSITEAWLNPSNLLMMASNIRKGLNEYVNENIETKKINHNYEQLKLKLSQIDAELKLTSNNANNNILIVNNDCFKYLEKYGFKVMSLEENENLTDKALSEIKEILDNKRANYIFLKDEEEENETIKSLKEQYDLKTQSLNSLSTLTSKQRIDKKDYMTIMLDNINSIKLEVTQ